MQTSVYLQMQLCLLPSANFDLHIYREVWRHCTIPGTFHAIAAAVWGMLQGKGFDLRLPEVPPHVDALMTGAKELNVNSSVADNPVADVVGGTSRNVPVVTDW